MSLVQLPKTFLAEEASSDLSELVSLIHLPLPNEKKIGTEIPHCSSTELLV